MNIVATIVRDNPILVDGSKFLVDNLVAAVKSHPVIVKDILVRQSQLLEIIIQQHPEVIQQLRSSPRYRPPRRPAGHQVTILIPASDSSFKFYWLSLVISFCGN